MLIAEELLLVALDDTSGRPLIGGDRLRPGLGGAVLAELALMERIGVTPSSEGWRTRGRLTITSLKPTDDPELDDTLQKIAPRGKVSRERRVARARSLLAAERAR